MNVSDGKTGNTYQKEVPKEKEALLLGKKIGEKIDGDIIGLAGYKVQITGGSDIAGFPMRNDVPGQKRVKTVLGYGPGVRSLRKGEKRKKLVAGNTIAAATMQVNTKIVEYGTAALDALGFAPKPKGEKKAEEKK
jgi:small subunit ribosomal protein S6e